MSRLAGTGLVRGNHPPGLATTRLPSDKDDDALVPILFDGGTLVLRPYFKPAL